MRIILVSGIYPPDIGGPATHVHDLSKALRDRGHVVTVLTLGDVPRKTCAEDVIRFPRRWFWARRLSAIASWLVANRARYDVVYASSLHPAAVLGARLAARPVGVKVVGDHAWERARRRGLTDLGFEAFQERTAREPWRVRMMRRARNTGLRRASAVVAPSDYLRHTIDRWLSGPSGAWVIANGVRVAPPSADRTRAGGGEPGLSLVWAGRLIPHKRVDVLIKALAATEGAHLDIVGDGSEERRLRELAVRTGAEDRVTFVGACSHDATLARIARADALLLASEYEGLPHVAIEALVAGVPVVAPAVGGAGEAITDGENAIVLAKDDAAAFAEAFARLRDEPDLRERLHAGALRSGEGWRFDRVADDVERLLGRLPLPRAILLGKTRVPAPLGALSSKYELLQRHLAPTQISVGHLGRRWSGRVRFVGFPDIRPGVLGGALFYPLAPVVAVIRAMGRQRAAIVCQSPLEAVGVVASSRVLPRVFRPPLVVEVHGDWHTATRLYGGARRKALAGTVDRACSWAIRRADRVRTVSASMEEVVRDAGYAGFVDRYPTFADLSDFLSEPPVDLPATPTVLYAGALEPTKGPDRLLDAWPAVLEAVPEAVLIVAGDGSMRAALIEQIEAAQIGESVSLVGHVSRERLGDLLDQASTLVVPSRSEGMGRSVLEAMARARPVVATAVGGIPELVDDGRTGVLVLDGDVSAMSKAIVSLLEDRDLARAMGEEARREVHRADPIAEYERGVARLAEWIRSCT